jgi:hypothetical protein
VVDGRGGRGEEEEGAACDEEEEARGGDELGSLGDRIVGWSLVGFVCKRGLLS